MDSFKAILVLTILSLCADMLLEIFVNEFCRHEQQCTYQVETQKSRTSIIPGSHIRRLEGIRCSIRSEINTQTARMLNHVTLGTGTEHKDMEYINHTQVCSNFELETPNEPFGTMYVLANYMTARMHYQENMIVVKPGSLILALLKSYQSYTTTAIIFSLQPPSAFVSPGTAPFSSVFLSRDIDRY